MNIKFLVHVRRVSAMAAVATALAFLPTNMAFAVEQLAQAQAHPAPTIGVLDLQLILQNSLAAQGVRLERDKFVNKYQKEVTDMETQLRAEDQELAGQRNLMSQEVFQQRAQEFQQKMAEFQAVVRDKQQNLERAFQQAMVQIQQELFLIARDIAQEREVNVVTYRSQLMIFDPAMDITQPALRMLDERLPEVEFPDPEAANEDSAD